MIPIGGSCYTQEVARQVRYTLHLSGKPISEVEQYMRSSYSFPQNLLTVTHNPSSSRLELQQDLRFVPLDRGLCPHTQRVEEFGLRCHHYGQPWRRAVSIRLLVHRSVRGGGEEHPLRIGGRAGSPPQLMSLCSVFGAIGLLA